MAFIAMHNWRKEIIKRDEKVCTKCQIKKPMSEFHDWGPSSDGKRQSCKQCVRDYVVKKRKEKLADPFDKFCF